MPVKSIQQYSSHLYTATLTRMRENASLLCMYDTHWGCLQNGTFTLILKYIYLTP